MNEPVHAMDQGLQVPTRADMGHGTPVRDAQRRSVGQLKRVWACGCWIVGKHFTLFELALCVWVSRVSKVVCTLRFDLFLFSSRVGIMIPNHNWYMIGWRDGCLANSQATKQRRMWPRSRGPWVCKHVGETQFGTAGAAGGLSSVRDYSTL
jgi:hypothetical protein